MKRKMMAVLGIFLIGSLLTGCGYQNADPDETIIHYSGGPIQHNIKFEGCVKPGGSKYTGPGDKNYSYPAGQRTYRFDNQNKGAESPAISIVSSDLVEMTVEGTATFNFTTDCEKVRKFHEAIGLKFRNQYPDKNAYWPQILESYVKQALDRSMDASAKGLSFRDLYANPDAKKQWEDAVSVMVPQVINGIAGDNYFTDFRLNLQVPQPPAAIKQGFTDRQASVEQNEAQKARNEQIRTTLDGIKSEIDILGPEAWAKKYAIDSGKVGTFVIAPQGTGTVVGK